ncbi:MAG: S1 RNA-binding domain-containing protein, partial [Tannerella sp.]|nr:S1 RNA-binding domain-containing protein [Tannerella sp.]
MENLKNIVPVEDFNWDSFEKGEAFEEQNKEDLMKTYDETLSTMKDKEVVVGTVTALNKREVVVNIGFKSDGVVPMSEFRYNPELQTGDKVEVFIENQED